jgi:hypothetical protein
LGPMDGMETLCISFFAYHLLLVINEKVFWDIRRSLAEKPLQA